MNILMIGGTRFVGKHCAELLLAKGHSVTVFHRGKTASVLPGAHEIIGDRDGDLSVLQTRQWDAVIDTCGYVPRVVKKSCDALQNNTRRYIFISTISVYAEFNKPGLTEDSALAVIDDPQTEVVDERTYGALKVLCEQVINETFGDNATIVRPGLIVGPDDYTDRYTYWIRRVAQGGRIVAPDEKEMHTQYVDVRDLAAFTVLLLEKGIGTTVHVTGPEKPLTLGEHLSLCKDMLNKDAEFVWMPAKFLEEQKVGPWMDMPLWIPQESDMSGLDRVDISKALSLGLKCRPIADTIRDTSVWDTSREQLPMKAGLSPEREQSVLAQWDARKS